MRPSSIERRHWRDKCRELLAVHIRQRVGVAIEPSDVRLVTSKEDQYCWRAVPQMRHLFSKQLSDHNLGAFKDLCRGVGITFEAVPRSDNRSITPGQTTLSSRIDELQELNADLVKEMSNLRDRLATEMAARERLESELDLVNETNRLLKEDARKTSQQCDHFRNACHKYAEGIRRMFPIVEGLRNTATFTAEGEF
ncbi:hypothetical protein GE09DRAFT_1045727 [Coniochaeta sp. 2T2.1]|nr:hypothetical protein GE09DRAFT_1045727 [Coniochaeta sp. 2T2.1]